MNILIKSLAMWLGMLGVTAIAVANGVYVAPDYEYVGSVAGSEEGIGGWIGIAACGLVVLLLLLLLMKSLLSKRLKRRKYRLSQKRARGGRHSQTLVKRHAKGRQFSGDIDIPEDKTRVAIEKKVHETFAKTQEMADMIASSNFDPNQAGNIEMLNTRLRECKLAFDSYCEAMREERIKAFVRMEDTPSSFCLESILKTSIEPYAKAGKGNANVALEYEKNAPTQFHGEEKRIREIVTRMLDLGVKDLIKGEFVVRAESKRGSETQASVRISLDPSGNQASLFKLIRNQSGNAPKVSDSKEFGQIEDLVKDLGGEFRIRTSALGTSSLVLELTLDTAETAEIQGADLTEDTYKGKRILVVEDNEDYLNVLTNLLQRWGFSIATATTGESAMRMLDTEPNFDIGLFDISLPRVSGEELAAHCRECRDLSHMKLISLSGLGIAPSKDLFDSSLFKPVTPEALKESLASVATVEA